MIRLNAATVPGRLEDATLNITPGERLGLIGPSGSGKTTLLSLITGRLSPTTGSVHLEPGQRLGYIPQDPGASLLPGASAAQAIVEPVRIRRGNVAAALARVPNLLRLVNMEESMSTRPVEHLSGGQRQRVAVCRALIDDPHVIVADEALSALDGDTSILVERLLIDSGATVVLVSHDMAAVRRMCTCVAFLHERRIAATGPVSLIDEPDKGPLAHFVHAAEELAT